MACNSLVAQAPGKAKKEDSKPPTAGFGRPRNATHVHQNKSMGWGYNLALTWYGQTFRGHGCGAFGVRWPATAFYCDWLRQRKKVLPSVARRSAAPLECGGPPPLFVGRWHRRRESGGQFFDEPAFRGLDVLGRFEAESDGFADIASRLVERIPFGNTARQRRRVRRITAFVGWFEHYCYFHRHRQSLDCVATVTGFHSIGTGETKVPPLFGGLSS